MILFLNPVWGDILIEGIMHKIIAPEERNIYCHISLRMELYREQQSFSLLICCSYGAIQLSKY